MRNCYRDGFYLGLSLALLVAVYLMWLWQPERQVSRHTENLFRALEDKDWARVSEFIATDYQDQWQNDRARLLERTREVFRYLRNVKFAAAAPEIRRENGNAHWQSRITIEGDAGEVMSIVKERVNSLTTPFDLEWRHLSAKPWDWKLVRVTNADLAIPDGYGE